MGDRSYAVDPPADRRADLSGLARRGQPTHQQPLPLPARRLGGELLQHAPVARAQRPGAPRLPLRSPDRPRGVQG